MKKFLLTTVLAVTGCDNAFVVENIDVATCAWLPAWMADCTSDEVHDKAVGILQYGLVEAKVTCSEVVNHQNDGCGRLENGGATYVGHRLIDGSALVTLDQQTFLLGRSEASAEPMSVVHSSYPSDTWFVSGGKLIVHKDGCTDIVVDIETECAGYNLSAFLK